MKYAIVLMLVICLLGFGCLGSAPSSNEGSAGSGANALQAAAPAMDLSGTSQAPQYIAQSGSITVKVNDGELQSRYDELSADLKAEGAVIGDVYYSETGDRDQYTVTVKVAPAKFDAMMSSLKQIGEVTDMSVSLEDVTKQTMDLDTRITNDQVELARLYAIYNQSSNVSDILDVEREITRVETDMEMLKSEKDTLSAEVDLSTINVSLYQDKPATTQLSLSIESLGSTFFAAMAAAITIVVAVAGFLLPIAIVLGALWLAYKALRGGGRTRPRQPEHSRIPPPQ